MSAVSQSPTQHDFVQHPYDFYAKKRALGKAHFWNEYKMLAAFSHDQVSAILKNRKLGREVPPELATEPAPHTVPFYKIEAHSMLELEPPRHTRLRGLVMRAFTSRRIKTLAPDITELTHQLIDQFPEGEFDLLPAFATHIPVVIICRLLGVPETKADELLK